MRLPVALTLAALVACSPKEQPATPSAADALADAAKAKALPAEHYVSPTEKFELTLPGAWTGHYAVAERKDTTAGARLAIDFRFKPDSGSKAPPLTAIVIRVFPKKVWDAAIAKNGAPPAAFLGERPGEVFALLLPSSNPYPPNSAEAPIYDRMIISLSQGGQQVHIAFKP
jgi:hypothetical protein